MKTKSGKTSAMLKEDKERMRSLVTETLTLLCKNGLSFNKQFTLNALIGINLDSDKEFHFIVSETFSNSLEDKGTKKVARSQCADSSDDYDSSSGSETSEEDEVEKKKPPMKSSIVSKMHNEVTLDLECQNSDEVRVKSEPRWDEGRKVESSHRKQQRESPGSQMGNWRVVDKMNQNSSKSKPAKFLPLPNQNDIIDSGATWQQFAALIPDGATGDNSQGTLDENWPQQNLTDDIFQVANSNYLDACSWDYGSFGTPGKSKRGRMKMPITEERIGRKILRCRGNVISVSKAQHVFNYGCRPTFQRLKEVMLVLEQQGFGYMRMMEFEEKKTKIRQTAVKAMSFVKKPVEEVATLLPMYEITPEDYTALYMGLPAAPSSDRLSIASMADRLPMASMADQLPVASMGDHLHLPVAPATDHLPSASHNDQMHLPVAPVTNQLPMSSIAEQLPIQSIADQQQEQQLNLLGMDQT